MYVSYELHIFNVHKSEDNHLVCLKCGVLNGFTLFYKKYMCICGARYIGWPVQKKFLYKEN